MKAARSPGGTTRPAASRSTIRRHRREQRPPGAEIGQHLRRDRVDAGVGIEHGHQHVAAGHNLGKIGEGLERQQHEIGQPGAVGAQPVRAETFRHHHDADVRAVAEALGGGEQQARIVLEPDRARIEENQLVGEAMRARPGIVARLRRQFLARRPVLDDVDARARHAPALEDRHEILGDDDRARRSAQQLPLQRRVARRDEMADHRQLA
jgi:hypothetical protein